MIIFFLMLLVVMSIPLNVVSFVFGLMIRNRTRPIAVTFPIIGIVLIASAFLSLVISAMLIPSKSYDDSSASSLFGWIALGLSIGAFLVGIVSIILVFTFRSRYLASIKEEPITVALPKMKDDKPSASNNSTGYIEEIKQLKELLDSGAITQEEFDKKKKELLNK